MKTQSNIKKKTYAFALNTVKLCLIVQKDHKEYVLTKQLIRSATSIGANIEEGSQAPTRADFIYKHTISLKEAFESNYWIRLLKDTGLVSPQIASDLLNDCIEIQKILITIVKKSKENLKKVWLPWLVNITFGQIFPITYHLYPITYSLSPNNSNALSKLFKTFGISSMLQVPTDNRYQSEFSDAPKAEKGTTANCAWLSK